MTQYPRCVGPIRETTLSPKGQWPEWTFILRVFEGCMRFLTNCCVLDLGASNSLYVFVDGKTILEFQNGHRNTTPSSYMVGQPQSMSKREFLAKNIIKLYPKSK